MLGIFGKLIFDIPLWMWLSAISSICFFIYALFFFGDGIEKIRGLWFKLRWGEKVIKIIMHYKSGYYKVYWRLLPHEDIFKIKKGDYIYDSNVITKEDDFFIDKSNNKKPKLLIAKNVFVKEKDGKEIFRIGDTEEYEFDKLAGIREKGKKYSELHYISGIPQPLSFDMDISGGSKDGEKPEIKFSAYSLRKFKENDLFEKLLRLKGETKLMTLLLILVIINTCVSMFVMGKLMGWIK